MAVVSPFPFVNADSYLALPRDPQQWIIQGIVPTGGLTNFFGQPKAGKSWITWGLALAVAGNEPEWVGFPVLKHGPVAYLQIDTSRGEWAKRVLDSKKHGYDVSNIHICDLLLTPYYPVNLLDSQQVEDLRAGLKEAEPILIIIDTIREAHSGDENDSTIMRNVVTNIISACRWGETSPAIVLLSHSRKETAQTKYGGTSIMGDNRGSSYMPGKMDCIVQCFGSETTGITGMQYKGRSVEAGKIALTHNDWGLVILDAADAAYHSLLVRRVAEMRLADPEVTVNAMAGILASETTYKKQRAINDHIEQHLAALDGRVWKKPKKKK